MVITNNQRLALFFTLRVSVSARARDKERPNDALRHVGRADGDFETNDDVVIGNSAQQHRMDFGRTICYMFIFLFHRFRSIRSSVVLRCLNWCCLSQYWLRGNAYQILLV